VDTEEIADLLAVDPVWSAYALADLRPEMAPYCRWLVHHHGTASAVALLFNGLEPPVLFAQGDPAALEAALFGADLPAIVYLSVREEHAPAIARWYDHHDRRHMWRMVWRQSAGDGRIASATGGILGAAMQQRSARVEGGPERDSEWNSEWNHSSLCRLLPSHAAVPEILAPVRRLTTADVAQVRALFAHGGPFTPDAFAEHQIESGVFFSVEDGAGGLAAVGGTHVVDYVSGVAAIGNMYTRPDCRRRGHAGAILAAIVNEVRANGATTIVLNVDQRNGGARRLYEQHGFTVHCPYIEGVATACR